MTNPPNKPGLSIDLGDELSSDLNVHKNLNQSLILTTEDKIKIVLMQTKEAINAQRDWWTPFGLLVSFITTLCTADFKTTLGLNKEFWHAIFVVFSLISGGWLFKSIVGLIRNWSGNEIDDIIKKIKIDVKSKSGT